MRSRVLSDARESVRTRNLLLGASSVNNQRYKRIAVISAASIEEGFLRP